MRTTGDVYLWPAAAERKLRMAYQAGLPAYLYGVTGVGKTSDPAFSREERIFLCLCTEYDAG